MSGGLGIFLGIAGTQFFAAFTQANLPQVADVPIDLRVLAFTLGISVLSGVAFGLTPSMQLSRPNIGGILADEGRGATGNRQRNRARNALVVVQIALSMVLLVGSGLLIRSFLRLRTVDPGFDATHTLTAQTFLSPATYPQPPQRIAFYQDALREMQSIPGVEAAAISTALPITPTHESPARFEGQPEVDLGKRPLVMIESISPDYPKVMRMSLVEGRLFDDGDNATAAPVALVNQTSVRRFWPNEDPIGRLVWIGNLAPMRVVGVLRDVKNDSLATPPQPEYFSRSHSPRLSLLQCSTSLFIPRWTRTLSPLRCAKELSP